MLATNIDSAIEAILEAVSAEEDRMPPKKKLVVKSAISCFAEFGYDATSTRMIADRAGVAEATIFRHFGTKSALLLRIAEPVVKRVLTPAAEDQALGLQRQSADLREFLRAIMLSRLAFVDRYAPLVRIVLQEYMVNPELRAMLQKHLGGVLAKVSVSVAAQFAQSGHIMAASSERALRYSISLLAGYYVNRSILAPNGDWDDEAEVDAMLDVLLKGLAPD